MNKYSDNKFMDPRPITWDNALTRTRALLRLDGHNPSDVEVLRIADRAFAPVPDTEDSLFIPCMNRLEFWCTADAEMYPPARATATAPKSFGAGELLALSGALCNSLFWIKLDPATLLALRVSALLAETCTAGGEVDALRSHLECYEMFLTRNADVVDAYSVAAVEAMISLIEEMMPNEG